MYQQIAAANYLTAAAAATWHSRRAEPESMPQSPLSSAWSSSEQTSAVRSPSPSSEDSRDASSHPLHLVTEEATRRRQEEEAAERRREAERKRDRSRSPSPAPKSPFSVKSLSKPQSSSPIIKTSPASPLTEPRPCSPLTPPPGKEGKSPSSSSSAGSSLVPPLSTSSASSSKTTIKPRSGPKPKPSPLSIEAITGSPPIVSPRQFSASSLNTPVVNLPSPPYSGVGTKSPFLLHHVWPSLSPLASLSPHYAGSPRGIHHFTFPNLPPHFSHLPHPVSPLLPPTFDFTALASPTEKPATVHVLQ